MDEAGTGSPPERDGDRWGRPVSELNDVVWRRVLLIGAGAAAVWLIDIIFPSPGTLRWWLLTLAAGWVWFTAVRMLLLDTKFPRFWMIWLGLSAAALLPSGADQAGTIIAITASSLFLIFRTYQPYGHLAGSRRARMALLYVIVLFLIPWGPGGEVPGSWFGGLAHHAALYALVSLRVFLGLSLLHLLFRMRLHFLRLKPKLAVLSFFVALVPLVLVVVFFLIVTFGALGMQRASHARSVLIDWLEQDTLMGPDEFGEEDPAWREAFLARLAEPVPPDTSQVWRYVEESRPDSVIQLGENVQFRPAEGDTGTVMYWVPADTSAFFRGGDALWALRIQGVAGGRPTARGFKMDRPDMERLAEIVRADLIIAGLGLGGEGTRVDTSEGRITVTREEESPDVQLEGIYGTPPAGPDSTRSFLDRRLYFGGAVLPYMAWQDEGEYISTGSAVLAARKDIRGLLGEILGSSDQFSVILAVILGTVAVLFLIVEAAALFLGIRITAGITSAVKKLHAGTRRLAEGDLETRITVPNEDEFGDLALSFNRMTRAVKRGREEAVERERLERELETARSIQERFLPTTLPDLQGFELAATSLPSLQVGGDYFDFVELEEGLVGIAIGDVSGKGIPAALLMANLQAALQGQVIHPGSVGQTVSRVNDLIVRSSERQMFATFFYGVLDRTSGRFTYSNAGHNPPMVLRADGMMDRLEEGGIVLGMMSGQPYEEGTVVLEAGDVMVLFSDGITEAEGPREDEAVDGDDEEMPSPNHFEEKRLETSIRGSASSSAQEIRDRVLEDVQSFTRGEPQSDDITLVVVKRSEVPASTP